MLEPLKQWICDTCTGIIQRPEEGWFEWLSGEESYRDYHGFRIVHHTAYSPLSKEARERGLRHPGCYGYENRAGRKDDHLHHIVGDHGVLFMLRLLDVGEYHQRDFDGPLVKDVREWVEIFRRLFVPYYEEARLYWSQAEADGMLYGENEISIFRPALLKEIIERYSEF